MKKSLFVLSAVLFFAISSQSQNSYSFARLTGNTYSDLTGDNMVAGFNTAGLYNIPDFAGETFKFYDLPFTFGGLKTIAIGEAPFLRVDNDSSAVIIDVAFSYIDTIDPSSRISYLATGLNGNRILKVQYKNFKLSYGPTGNFINVQIWYYQQTGVVELRYGPRSVNNASGYNNIQGPNIGIFYAPDSFTSCYEKLWCEGSPNTVILDSAANFSFDAMNGVPDNGTVFRFTPRTQTLTSVSLKETKNLGGLMIQPNPCRDKMTVSCKLSSVLFQVRDIYGTEVKRVKSSGNSTEIDLAGLPAGYYLLMITDEYGQQSGSKFLIDR